MTKVFPKPSAFRWVTVGAACYFGWLFVNICLAAVFPLFLLIERFGGGRGKHALRRLSVGLLRGFFLGYLPLLGLYRIRLDGDPRELDELGPCLVVSNHRSWLDALVLIALVPRIRVVVSRNYAKVPIVSRGMRWVESIFLERNSRESVIECFEEAKRGLRHGAPVGVFPEGTRSPIGRLKSFSGVFFRAAIEENVPVLPVVMHMDRPFLGPGAENFLTDRRAVLRIQLLAMEWPAPNERGEDLAYRAQRRLSRVLRRLDSEIE